MSHKGKSRTRMARVDLMKRNAANARKKDRQRARSYDRQSYDGNSNQEQ